MIPLLEKRGLIIAIALALVATILVITWMNQQQQRMAGELARKFENLKAREANTTDVVLAKIDIPAGKIISDEMLFTKSISRDSLPAGAAVSIARVVEHISRAPIKKDSPILTEALAWPTTKGTTLAMKTPIGKRAITISVDNIASLLGMINPGDYVDVLGLIPLPVQVEGKQSAQLATVPLFQNVLVLAVGPQIGAALEQESGSRRKTEESVTKDKAPVITFALSPEEANLLVFVGEQGKIRLVLRSPGDAKTEAVQPASWDTLLKYLFPQMEMKAGEEIGKEIPQVKKEIPQVEIIRGFKKEMVPLTQSK